MLRGGQEKYGMIRTLSSWTIWDPGPKEGVHYCWGADNNGLKSPESLCEWSSFCFQALKYQQGVLGIKKKKNGVTSYYPVNHSHALHKSLFRALVITWKEWKVEGDEGQLCNPRILAMKQLGFRRLWCIDLPQKEVSLGSLMDTYVPLIRAFLWAMMGINE